MNASTVILYSKKKKARLTALGNLLLNTSENKSPTTQSFFFLNVP